MRGAERKLEKKRWKKGRSKRGKKEKNEDKKICPFDDKKVCPVTIMNPRGAIQGDFSLFFGTVVI